MHWLLTTVLLNTLAQPPVQPGLYNRTLDVDGVGNVTYGIFIPNNYAPENPRPLVLALHPGGSTGAYYGTQFLRSIVGPALQEWEAIIVAPDGPDRRWTNAVSEQGVLAVGATVFPAGTGQTDHCYQ